MVAGQTQRLFSRKHYAHEQAKNESHQGSKKTRKGHWFSGIPDRAFLRKNQATHKTSPKKQEGFSFSPRPSQNGCQKKKTDGVSGKNQRKRI